ncbi:MAG: hypothetical protein ACYSTF_08000 [Planctomycetota bacterium]
MGESERVIEVSMRRAAVSVGLVILVLGSGCKSERSISVDSGKIIAAGNPFGQIWGFPSEAMDGVFYYYSYGAEDFGNFIYFYDLKELEVTEVVSGGYDNGYGRLTNSLTNESLLPGAPSGGIEGRIKEMVLGDDGSLIFESEVGERHRIHFEEGRKLTISGAEPACEVKNFKLNKEGFVSDYKKAISKGAVKARIVHGGVKVRTNKANYLIEGIEAVGIHLSQDGRRLVVFAKVAMLELKWGPERGLLWANDSEKRQVMRKFEEEIKDEGRRAKVIRWWTHKNVNAAVVYDLDNI